MAANTVETVPVPDVKEMTDRELLEEIVRNNRAVIAAVSEFQKMGPGGIMRMLMGK
jgi:hypothetical protein